MIPLLAHLKRIDADGARPFEDMCYEVRAQAYSYYHLVVDPAKGKAKSAKHCLVAALDIYESFHMVQQQASWAAKGARVPFSK